MGPIGFKTAAIPHNGTFLTRHGALEVEDCYACGYAHQTKLPTQEEVDKYYAEDNFYSGHSPSDWFDNEREEHFAGMWNPAYDFQLDLIERYISRGDYILDVGTGAGWFPRRARERYRPTIGIDPSAKAHETAVIYSNMYGKQFYKTLDELPLVPFANLVRFSLVLEHILKPVEFITSHVKKCVDSAGEDRMPILIVVPNEFNPLQKKIVERRANDSWFVQKPHINYFSRTGIHRMLDKAGYYVRLYEGGTFPMELFYLQGLNYIDDPRVGLACHRKRLKFEKIMGRKAFELYGVLYRKLGWGRESITLASKTYVEGK